MGEMEESKKNLPSYLVLATMLLLTVLGVLLFFAAGLNSDSFLYIIPKPLSILPFLLSFPFYIAIEFLCLHLRNKDDFAIYAFYGENHEKTVKITFFFTLGALVLGLVLFFVNQADLVLSCVLGSLASVLGMGCYFILTMAQEKKRSKPFFVSLAFLSLTVIIPLATHLVALLHNENLVLLYGLLPLTCIAMALAGKKA